LVERLRDAAIDLEAAFETDQAVLLLAATEVTQKITLGEMRASTVCAGC
jgi:hypothetical protein